MCRPARVGTWRVRRPRSEAADAAGGIARGATVIAALTIVARLFGLIRTAPSRSCPPATGRIRPDQRGSTRRSCCPGSGPPPSWRSRCPPCWPRSRIRCPSSCSRLSCFLAGLAAGAVGAGVGVAICLAAPAGSSRRPPWRRSRPGRLHRVRRGRLSPGPGRPEAVVARLRRTGGTAVSYVRLVEVLRRPGRRSCWNRCVLKPDVHWDQETVSPGRSRRSSTARCTVVLEHVVLVSGDVDRNHPGAIGLGRAVLTEQPLKPQLRAAVQAEPMAGLKRKALPRR